MGLLVLVLVVLLVVAVVLVPVTGKAEPRGKVKCAVTREMGSMSAAWISRRRRAFRLAISPA